MLYSLSISLLKYHVSTERNSLVFYEPGKGTAEQIGQCDFISGHTTLLTQVQVLTHAELTRWFFPLLY